MRWHYNMINQSGGPLVRDMDIYAASGLIAGEPLIAIAGDNQSLLQAPSGATIPDFVGLLLETPTNQASALASGTIYSAKCCINPDAIYVAEYDKTLTDIDVVSSTSLATTLGTCDDNLDGCWLYVNSGTGIGQLAFIGAATTTVFTLDTTTAWATTPDATSDVILIRPPFALNTDLGTSYTMIQTDEDTTGLILTLDNYIQSSTIPWGPMRPRQHHMKTGLNNDNVQFFSDLHFLDNVLTKPTVFTA